MSSFFTAPASQKKRKRSQPTDGPTAKRATATRKPQRDESISGSDESDDERAAARGEDYGGIEDEDDESESEDVAAKRIRLAEQYLANTQREVLVEEGFDAAEVDAENLRRRMGDRLKEDTAESKGKLYRWIADGLDWSGAKQNTTKVAAQTVTGVAVQGRYAFTVTKDMVLSKWELPTHEVPMKDGKQVGRVRSRPKKVGSTRGRRGMKNDRDYQHHVGAILCVAASPDGKFVVTGGLDKRIVVWDAATLKPLKVFTQHRDSVSSLVFRRGTNQLFSASRDRTVKIWSLDELAYVETLFGHQDEVVDVSALAQEKCVTVGARDRTARQWKVVEESQLVFRGGGAPGRSKSDRSKGAARDIHEPEQKAYNEGSMDRVACIDDETFVTGSDNGSLSLWNVHKKKPVFTYALAHGLDPPLPLKALSAEAHPEESAQGEPQPRWITALRAIPFSDTFVSGSWDGAVRAWRISEDKRRIEPLGTLGRQDESPSDPDSTMVGIETDLSAIATSKLIVGVVNDLAIVDRGERAKDGVLVAAAVGQQHRLGRWSEMAEAKNSLVLLEVSRKSSGAGDTPNGQHMQIDAPTTRQTAQTPPDAKPTAIPAAIVRAPASESGSVHSPASAQVLRETREAANAGEHAKDAQDVETEQDENDSFKATTASAQVTHQEDDAAGEGEMEEDFAGFDD